MQPGAESEIQDRRYNFDGYIDNKLKRLNCETGSLISTVMHLYVFEIICTFCVTRDG